jgi:hypothetical protein
MKTSKKSKYDVVRRELDFEFSSWYDYYVYDFEDFDDCYDYSYVKKDIYEEIISGPIFRRKKSINLYFPYGIVDMNSIYSKQERRNKFIDELLGYTNHKISYKPTFADIFKNKNINEED